MQLGRSALLFTSNLAHFFAITFIPLGKAASISLTAPLIVTLLGALRKTGGKRGVASLCIGGGEATAIAVEMA